MTASLNKRKEINLKENSDTLPKILLSILKIGIAWTIICLVLGWIAWQFDSIEPYDPDITKTWIIFGFGVMAGITLATSKVEGLGRIGNRFIRLSGAAMIPASLIFAMMIV